MNNLETKARSEISLLRSSVTEFRFLAAEGSDCCRRRRRRHSASVELLERRNETNGGVYMPFKFQRWVDCHLISKIQNYNLSSQQAYAEFFDRPDPPLLISFFPSSLPSLSRRLWIPLSLCSSTFIIFFSHPPLRSAAAALRIKSESRVFFPAT